MGKLKDLNLSGKTAVLGKDESEVGSLSDKGWRRVVRCGSFLGWLPPTWTGDNTTMHTTETAVEAQRFYESRY